MPGNLRTLLYSLSYMLNFGHFVVSNSGNRKTGRRIGNMAEICDQVWLALENVHCAPELLFQIHPLHGVCRWYPAVRAQDSHVIMSASWVGLVSCPTPHMPPGEKRSCKQTQISWAYYPKVIRTNEFGRSVIITQHFPYNSKICSSLFEYLYYFWADCPQNVLNIARLHCHKRVLAQEIQLDSPDYFSLWEGGVWGRG